MKFDIDWKIFSKKFSILCFSLEISWNIFTRVFSVVCFTIKLLCCRNGEIRWRSEFKWKVFENKKFEFCSFLSRFESKIMIFVADIARSSISDRTSISIWISKTHSSHSGFTLFKMSFKRSYIGIRDYFSAIITVFCSFLLF